MLSLIPAALLALVLSYNVTKEDVRRLLNAGLSEQTIVEFIRRNAPAEPLSVEDMTELKAVGATDAVLKAMLEASRTSEAVPPSSSSSTSDSYYSYPGTSYSYSYPQYYSYPYSSYYTPYYSYSYPYYYPYYSYYRPYSCYRYPYRYPYYQNYNYQHYNYGRSSPYSVSTYRNPHPQQQPLRQQQQVQPLRPQQQMQPVRPQQQVQPRSQPAQPHHGSGTYRR